MSAFAANGLSLFTFVSYGCSIWGVVRCDVPGCPVYRVDTSQSELEADPEDFDESLLMPPAYVLEATTLEGWFEGWLAEVAR